ncbi:portal protein [Nitrososphaeria virus YSH_1032793]|uniref:Portal protein n=1 Tax=Nitrososphaeria virus YSH_1032793 TaxID=3071320 RepID=A0A976YF09_9CAUD|nr:portal protein [Yangshan Harbor Nitrososphaeria virus]UVF62244.1 portal protein [Nitrososphaeria virus YSH_1032793]
MFNEKVESVEKKNFFQKVRDYVNPDNSVAYLCEADSSESSGVNDSKDYDGWTLPVVPFKKCQEYYLTVGKVQNTVESFINQVINRDWYFDAEETSESDMKKLKDWETKYHLSSLFENIVRDWLQCGNSIIGKSDYLPVQIETIIGLKRDSSGTVSAFGQARGDKIIPLQADKYFHSKYISLSRGAWGISLYNSLMTTFTDIDGKQSTPQLSLYRQSIQDNSKIHHRMGSPKSIWFFDVPDSIMKNHIKPLVKRMKHGDRLLLNKKPEMISETVDGKTRFTEATQQLSDEIETGLQSSSSRLITQPSAMADAGEAGEQDDERVKGIMEKLRRFMDEVIIPHVLGKSIEQCKVSFKWGTKDSFKLSYPDGLRNLLIDGVIDEDIVRHILTKRLNWDLPEDMVKKLTSRPKEPKIPQLQNFLQKNTGKDEEDPNMESLTLDLLKILLNKEKTE